MLKAMTPKEKRIYELGIEKGRQKLFEWFDERDFEPEDHDDYWDSSDKAHPEAYHNPNYCRLCEWEALKKALVKGEAQ